MEPGRRDRMIEKLAAGDEERRAHHIDSTESLRALPQTVAE
jgi:hypothetical protein